MVVPWMVRGCLRHYLDGQRQEGLLMGRDFVVAVDNWVSHRDLPLGYGQSFQPSLPSCIKLPSESSSYIAKALSTETCTQETS